MSSASGALLLRCLVPVLAVLSFTHCGPGPKGYIYGNNSSYAPIKPFVFKIDLATGQVVDVYPNLSGASTGRGVAVIGDTMYYTSGVSNCVFTYNLTTRVDNGCLFSVQGATGLASLAFDGTNLWIEEFLPTPAVVQYDITGTPTLISTFNPSLCAGATPYCDGLEYFYTSPSTIPNCPPGVLLSNRGDAQDPYDAYITSPPTSASCHPIFITPTKNNNTGIAWDGRFLYTSDYQTVPPALQVFTSTGNPYLFGLPILINNIPAGYTPVIEDLSIDYGRTYCYPPKRTVYSNGPVDGQSNKHYISYGDVVSNSFVISHVPPWATKELSDFCVGLWVAGGDTIEQFDYSITSAPNGGTVFVEGTVRPQLDFLFNVKSTLPGCQFAPPNDGCDVYQAHVSITGVNGVKGIILHAGTYYLNLTNAQDAQGSGVGWDQNNGTNCSSPGCPSKAWINGTTSIPSESLIVR